MADEFTFGDWIKKRRKQLDMTQADLAKKVDYSLATIRKIEQSGRRPSKQLAELMGDALELPERLHETFITFARLSESQVDVPETLATFLRSPITFGNQSQSLPVTQPFEPVESEANRHEPRFKEIVEQSTLPLFLTQTEPGKPIRYRPFVAREAELESLKDRLDASRTGKGNVLFIQGEAGAGKTTLLDTFIRQARADNPDLIITRGSCTVYTGVGDPYLPFIKLLSNLVGDIQPEWLDGGLAQNEANRLWHLLPLSLDLLIDHAPDLINLFLSKQFIERQLGAYARTTPWQYSDTLHLYAKLQAVETWTNMAQNRIFRSFESFLEQLSGHHPLVLVIDDLHWADISSIGLLSHLCQTLNNLPILIIGAFRPEDIAQSQQGKTHPLNLFIKETQRQLGDVTLDLDRTTQAGQAFVDALLDSETYQLEQSFRNRLAKLTGGHPLFTVEVLHELEEKGILIRDASGQLVQTETYWSALPPKVEGIIAKRVDRLSDEQRELLTIASVIGEQFSAEVIATVADQSLNSVVRQLSGQLERKHQLIRAQGIQLKGGQPVSTYLFRHNLIQTYIYDALDVFERALFHRSIAEAYETLFVPSSTQEELPALELARHFEEAQIPRKAAHYLLLAGRHAFRLIAYQEAVNHFEKGLALMEEIPETDQSLSMMFEFNQALGRTYWNNGETNRAFKAYEQAVALGRRISEPDALAQAALGLMDLHVRANWSLIHPITYVQEALQRMEGREDTLKISLRANELRIANMLSDPKQYAVSMAELRRVVKAAYQLDDPQAQYDALALNMIVDRRPSQLQWRLSQGPALVEAAKRIGALQWVYDAHCVVLFDAIIAGDLALVQETQNQIKEWADRSQIAFVFMFNHICEVMFAILNGRFEDAERSAFAAADLADKLDLTQASSSHGVQMFLIRWQQGRLNEIAPMVKMIVNQNSASALWSPGLMLLLTAIGERDQAQALFDGLISEIVSGAPFDAVYLTKLTFLVEACGLLNRYDEVSILYDKLYPFRDQAIVIGSLDACLGAASRHLGFLAGLKRDWPLAKSHFEHALQFNLNLEAWPWLAHTQHQYAEMLLRQGEPENRSIAASLLDDGLQTAQRLKMATLYRDIQNLKQQADLPL